MKEENNKPKNLQKLWRNNLITSTEYFSGYKQIN